MYLRLKLRCSFFKNNIHAKINNIKRKKKKRKASKPIKQMKMKYNIPMNLSFLSWEYPIK